MVDDMDWIFLIFSDCWRHVSSAARDISCSRASSLRSLDTASALAMTMTVRWENGAHHLPHSREREKKAIGEGARSRILIPSRLRHLHARLLLGPPSSHTINRTLTMIASRSPFLLKAFQRCAGAPSVSMRQFTSPAVKRFRLKQQAAGVLSENNLPLPHKIEEMDNSTLLTVAALENHEARIEVLKRHIMSVDKCSHEEATKTFEKIAKKNREGMALAALPYQLGIVLGVAAAVGSIPLVFDLQTTLWFNELYVTTEVAAPEDLETALEVGSWAWNWMEPPLGTLSFCLLALQFSRYVFTSCCSKDVDCIFLVSNLIGT